MEQRHRLEDIVLPETAKAAAPEINLVYDIPRKIVYTGEEIKAESFPIQNLSFKDQASKDRTCAGPCNCYSDCTCDPSCGCQRDCGCQESFYIK